MTELKKKLIVITPVYEDVESARILFSDIYRLYGDSVCIVAIDDGSVHRKITEKDVESSGLSGIVIKLRRNVGHQRAIAIGISYVSKYITPEHIVVIMDSDGEDRAESIGSLVKGLAEDDVDVVVAKRRNRIETWRFKAFYFLYKHVFKIFSGNEINFGNFMALKPAAIKRLVSMHELWIHVAAAVLVSKLRVGNCTLDRGARYVGASKMNFVSLALHGFRALMVYAEDVLVRVGVICAVVACFSIISSAIAIGLKLTGFATPGWFSVALGILFLVFLQTGALTLMTLMLTGVVRSGTVVNQLSVEGFIESVFLSNAEVFCEVGVDALPT